VISNPRAGRREADHGLDESIQELRRAGWDVTVCPTTAPFDATRLAREAAEAGMDAVLIAGGDGTLNEAVQALEGTDTALGYLPYGTVNIWAREIGLPGNPLAAARAIAGGRIETIDLGRANDRYFLLMAGIGLDADVVRRAQRIEHHKARFGILPYVAAGLLTLPLYRSADVELRYDGVIRRVQALMLVVGNTRFYAGRYQLTPNAVANDGWLDLCIVKGRGPLATVRQTFPVLLSGSVGLSDVEMLRVKSLTVQSDQPLPFQLDGELVGTTPVEFSIAPLALRVIVPQDFRSSLIA
jgi:diacylglycerol kinase (ATP)